jgi:cell division transport system permease protein
MVYLRDNISRNDIDILNMSIAQISGVRKIQFVSKEEAWRQFRENYSTLRLDEFMDDNPLPNSFKVEVADLSFIHLVANQLRNLNGVEEVNYGGDLAERMAVFIRIVTLAGVIIIFLLFSSTLMIVVNTIRLTVVARENEINIMSLVGASRSFVKYPFIFEGMLLGLLSSMLSMVLLKIGYNVIVVRLERLLPLLPINLNSMEINLVFVLVFFTGIFLGWLGSYFSVSKTLKQE